LTVKLLHYTPLHICSDAIRTCWNSFDKSDTKQYKVDAATDDISDFHLDGKVMIGPKDKDLIDRVGNKYKHASTLEHLYYNFYIKGISRALLQELARHRIASLSAKSTRYTLKELKKENFYSEEFDYSKYLVVTGMQQVDLANRAMLHNLQKALKDGVSNDFVKYMLPEAYKTELTWSINARSLQNFLSLRSDKAALWEIRKLAAAVFDVLPDDHKYLFKECMKG